MLWDRISRCRLANSIVNTIKWWLVGGCFLLHHKPLHNSCNSTINRARLKFPLNLHYRVFHAKLDIRKRCHSVSKNAKIVLKNDSKSTWAPVFCVKISWVWVKYFGHNINLKWNEHLVEKLFEHGFDSESSSLNCSQFSLIWDHSGICGSSRLEMRPI